VAIVNQAFAQRIFGTESPIGYGVKNNDGAMFVVGGVACWLTARRAARVDLQMVLRSE
jgi:hypothetical protein